MKSFDLLVIGGGSAGVACSRRAASYGKRVALFEHKRLGGTCVNVGCVPKKVTFNTSEIAGSLRLARDYGFNITASSFDYKVLRAKRDAYIERLNGIYNRMLTDLNVEIVPQTASFVSDKVIVAEGKEYTAPTIVIAAGGEPNWLNIPGREHAIDSDDFFNKVGDLPKKIAIVGGGYIGIEIAGMLRELGSNVTLICRRDQILYGFEQMLRDSLVEEMTRIGIKLQMKTNLAKIVNVSEKLKLVTTNGEVLEGFDTVLFAIGRHSVSKALKIENTSIKLNPNNSLSTDEWDETTVKGVYGLGDINGKIQLTPVAVAAGRVIADRLFGNKPASKMDYLNVPSVIFSHPPCGTIGLTENKAIEKYGKDNIKTYNSSFVNMLYSISNSKPKTRYKIVCEGPTEKVVGLHLFGKASDEILQGFGVAIKMGATKSDFDSCVAIHPTASEELVTMK